MLHSIWNTQGCPQEGGEVNIVTTTAQSKPHTFCDDIQAVHVKKDRTSVGCCNHILNFFDPRIDYPGNTSALDGQIICHG